MKKYLIITLYSNNNFGNKLQNYALQEYIKQLDKECVVFTQRVKYEKNTDNIFIYILWKFFNVFRKNNIIINDREDKFIKFSDKYIKYTDDFVGSNSRNKILGYDYYLYGSDQVWNPNGINSSNLFLGLLTNNNISYAASLSANSIPDRLKNKYRKALMLFKNISVREDKGKEILDDVLERNDIVVLIDPTMLLTNKDWDKIITKPKKLKSNKYILNYFLGDLSSSRKKAIYDFAEKNDCDVINILDKNDELYSSGPCEFLYLEKNAFLICTDSFHSSVFAFLFDRPFVIFDREQKEINDMSSRVDTLINKFKLKNRKFKGKITEENLNHDYTEAYKILEKERKKSEDFLKKALDIND